MQQRLRRTLSRCISRELLTLFMSQFETRDQLACQWANVGSSPTVTHVYLSDF